ncbi:ABC-type transport auxiliary lipoprotein family protein [Microbulbifer mangrovi]|uniref:ABC-type transport auxiliary lipoprotein family protein n=1 Tax=Microbulbifer mangrovi TaxID=927787 RepID=UPI0009906BB9|nr:ABC-type transport auxiliary lipoprotein family protein [Microbulbifer mangrovi]
MSERGYASTLSHTKTAVCLVVVASAILISGCTLFSPVESDERVAVINKVPREIPLRQTHRATLLVLPPSINPVYDTIRMAYRTEPHQVGYYRHHQWGATPAQMLLPLLARTLEKTQYFDAVATPPYFGPHSHALQIEIVEFMQDFTATPATLHLLLRVQLIDGKSTRIIASRTISVYEPMLHVSPSAGVVAANDAAANALQETAQFVLEQMPQTAH